MTSTIIAQDPSLESCKLCINSCTELLPLLLQQKLRSKSTAAVRNRQRGSFSEVGSQPTTEENALYADLKCTAGRN